VTSVTLKIWCTATTCSAVFKQNGKRHWKIDTVGRQYYRSLLRQDQERDFFPQSQTTTCFSFLEAGSVLTLEPTLLSRGDSVHGSTDENVFLRRVVIPLCGGNIDTTVLGRCLERGLAADGRLCRFVATVSDRAGGIAELTKRIASIGVWSVYSSCRAVFFVHLPICI